MGFISTLAVCVKISPALTQLAVGHANRWEEVAQCISDSNNVYRTSQMSPNLQTDTVVHRYTQRTTTIQSVHQMWTQGAAVIRAAERHVRRVSVKFQSWGIFAPLVLKTLANITRSYLALFSGAVPAYWWLESQGPFAMLEKRKQCRVRKDTETRERVRRAPWGFSLHERSGASPSFHGSARLY